MTRNLPPSANVAHPDSAKLCAPAAARNTDALVAMLRDHAPARGRALEIASGTGQHVVAFAAALPDLHWHPTDPDPARRASIDAYRAEADLSNIAPAQPLDATAPGWSQNHNEFNLIVLINLLHLISEKATRTLIAEAAQALVPTGTLILYGPFMRAGQLTSAGDARFHAELSAADSGIGYKDDLDILAWLDNTGLSTTAPQAMPANNLAFIARKP